MPAILKCRKTTFHFAICIKDLHTALDKAVIAAYGFVPEKDLLQQLLDLNLSLYAKEQNGEAIEKPGIPSYYKDKAKLVSDDCVVFDPKIK